MARAKFSEIEKDISDIRRGIEAEQESAEKLDRLGRILGSNSLSDINLDMDDQDFASVKAADEAMTGNIAVLIHGLDAITQSFSEDFKGMTQETWKEKFVGIFSSQKQDQMKAERVRSASIDESLSELIRKSDTIGELLNTQLNVLTEKQISVIGGQKNVNSKYEVTEQERQELEAVVLRVESEYEAALLKKEEATGPELAALETKIAELANEANEARETLQTKTAVLQSLSGYRKQYENYAESLAKQIAAQKTMIEKLKLDTEQRTILYKTLTESIKTSQQQDMAHQIDETGRLTDDMADTMMTQIGASSQNRITSMLENHKEYEKKMAEKAGLRDVANEKFAERFSVILKDMDNRYSEE